MDAIVGTGQVDGDQLVPVGRIEFGDTSHRGIDAGAVDQDVDVSEFFCRPAEELVDRVAIGDIAGACDDRHIAVVVPGDGIEWFLSSAGDGHLATGVGQCPGHRGPDTRTSTGDHGRAVVEIAHETPAVQETDRSKRPFLTVAHNSGKAVGTDGGWCGCQGRIDRDTASPSRRCPLAVKCPSSSK